MQRLLQLSVLAVLLFAVPAAAGGLAVPADGKNRGLLFRWVSGQFFLWAGFQLICVPLILKKESFRILVWLFLGYMAALVLLAVRKERRKKSKEPFLASGGEKGRRKGHLRLCREGLLHRKELLRLRKGELLRMPREELLLWAVFWGLLLFQLVQAVRLVYVDSDDAYYVAAASVAESSDTMYQIHPYTGQRMGGLDGRHALAPFSIWIAFLARLSGMRTVAVAQTALPVALIALSYGIYGLIAGELFPERDGRRPLFLIFVEILVLFGNVSVYTAETFLIGRGRQGKASLAGAVIPFLFFLLLVFLGRLQRRERISVPLCLLIGAAGLSGCLCSTLGTVLACMVLGIGGLLGAVYYKRPGALLSLALCCAPCAGYVLLYLVLK